MKNQKTSYAAPEVELVEVTVEQGFTVSPPTDEVDHNDYSGGGWE